MSNRGIQVALNKFTSASTCPIKRYCAAVVQVSFGSMKITEPLLKSEGGINNIEQIQLNNYLHMHACMLHYLPHHQIYHCKQLRNCQTEGYK